MPSNIPGPLQPTAPVPVPPTPIPISTPSAASAPPQSLAHQHPGNALSSTVPINPIPIPKIKKGWFGWEAAVDERDQLEKDGSQNHNIRRIAAYGALVLATVMYIGAFVVLGATLGFIPSALKIAIFDWRALAAMLVPLFTVPTVLIIGVLKVTTRPQDSMPQSAQEALGKMVEKAFDKLTD